MPHSQKQLKKPPSVVQLPGGVTVRARPFRITKLSESGRPLAFELAEGNVDSDCMLWVADSFMDYRLPQELIDRVQIRSEPPNVFKTRSLGISNMKTPAAVSGVCMGCDGVADNGVHDNDCPLRAMP